MGLQWTPESAYVKELAKWESEPTEFVRVPLRPRVFAEYPKAMYRAERATGGPAINGFIVAHSDVDEVRLLNLGWSVSQEAAIAKVHGEDRDIAAAAAHRAFQERTMSAKAQAEAAQVDASTPAHVPVIPETPIKKRQPYVRKTTAKETI